MDYLLEFVDKEYWISTKESIKDQIERKFYPNETSPTLLWQDSKILYKDDLLSWYLFLIDAYLTHPQDYDFAQGSRVIPVFKTLGKNIDLLKTIIGIDQKINQLVIQNKKDPDGLIFEILIALLYKRNGWTEVELLPENSNSKSPDIHACNLGSEFYIECKRMSKSSDYSIQEHEKWLSLWWSLSNYLKLDRRPMLFDFIFHKELNEIDEEYLTKEIVPKLQFVYRPGIIVDNETVTVDLQFLDIESINEKIGENDIKYNSSSFHKIVTDDYRPEKGISFIMEAKKSTYHPSYVSKVSFIAGARWECDSNEAIRKKARHIKRHLAEAVEQLPDSKPSIVHIGIEEIDGFFVESKRYEHILKSLSLFSTDAKDVRWIFCHLFDPTAPPDKNWDFGEKVHYFSNNQTKEPLDKMLAVVDEEEII